MPCGFWLSERVATPVIPPKSKRKVLIESDRANYRQRRKVQSMFGKLKDLQRIHPFDHRCAHAFMSAFWTAATVVFWLPQRFLGLQAGRSGPHEHRPLQLCKPAAYHSIPGHRVGRYCASQFLRCAKSSDREGGVLVSKTSGAEAIREIRSIAKSLDAAAARAAASLGMLLATSGRLDSVIRPTFELAKLIVPCQTLGYFWSDHQGNMVNAFCEQPYFLRSDVVMSCMRYQEADPGNWPTFNQNVLAGPLSGYLIPYQTPSFYNSDHFKYTFSVINAYHILDIVVHDGHVPHGCILAMRSEGHKSFSRNEIEASRKLASIFTLLGALEPRNLVASRRGSAGRLIVSKSGAVRFADAAAYQSLWMLTRASDAPPFGASDETIETLFHSTLGFIASQAWVEGGARHNAISSWGVFEISLVSLGEDLFVDIVQVEPFQAELSKKLARFPISSTKIIICWLLIHGFQRKEISSALDITLDTLSDHITEIYRALGVKGVGQLIVKLIG